MNILIIGNGILSLTTAFELLLIDSNLKISIVGPFTREGGATSCAGAMLNSFAEIDETTFKTDAGLKYFEMSFLATKMWKDFERKLISEAGDALPIHCQRCEVTKGGCYGEGTYLINNSSDKLEKENFKKIKKSLLEYNASFEEVNPEEISGYYPTDEKIASEAIIIQDEGWLNPKIVLMKLENILKKKNVKFIDDNINNIKEKSDTIYEAVGKKNTYQAEYFIVSNGFDTSKLLQRSKIDILKQKIYSGVGVSIELDATDIKFKNCIRTPNRGGACGIYAVPYFWNDKDNILIGASNYIDENPSYSGRSISIAHLLHSATAEINQKLYNSKVVQINVGNRPTSFDQFPLIGKASIKNLYVISGTKRDGFHNCPVISKFVAEDIMGKNEFKKIINGLEIFSPEREVIKDFDIDFSIKNNVKSLISEQIQHGYKPATYKQTEFIEKKLLDEVTKVHENFNEFEFAIPTLMYKLCKEGKIKYANNRIY
jgi:glycine oxidase